MIQSFSVNFVTACWICHWPDLGDEYIGADHCIHQKLGDNFTWKKERGGVGTEASGELRVLGPTDCTLETRVKAPTAQTAEHAGTLHPPPGS